MEFNKYNSITRADERVRIDTALRYHSKCTYILTEKVHGANFKFTTNGVDVHPGNRTQYVGYDFYGCGAVIERYKEAVIETYRNLVTRNIIEAGDYVDICGELFGGNYFGKTTPGAAKVQRKSCYIPGNDVVIFDIFIHDKGYMDWKDMETNISPSFTLVPVRNVSTLDVLLTLTNTFKTTIPQMFGEEEDERENWAEGWVVRPLTEQNFRSGKRVIFKSVSGKVKGSPRPSRVKAAVRLTGRDKELFDEFYEQISDYRIDQVLSKFGEADVDQTAVITGLLMKDIIADFKEKYGFKIQKQEFWIQGKRAINKSAAGAVMDYLLEGKNATTCDG